MGLILDTSILIHRERRRLTPRQALEDIQLHTKDEDAALSVVSIVELTHGVYRARTEPDRARRRAFRDGLAADMIVHPVTYEIAIAAGKIEGEQAALGVVIPFADLLIGVTALTLGYSVATTNARHFRFIPALTVLEL